MKKIVLSVGLAVLCGGCMWGRMSVNDPGVAARAAAIRVGVTRGEELPRILGAQPTMRLPGKDCATLGYTYSDTKSHGLMLLVVNFTRSTTVADTLYVEVDSKTDLVRAVRVPPKREIEWRFWPFGEAAE